MTFPPSVVTIGWPATRPDPSGTATLAPGTGRAACVACGTRDPVGGMTTTAQALIDRYRKNGVRDVSHVFYDGVRHEPMNDFGRDQFHADVLAWLRQHLSRN